MADLRDVIEEVPAYQFGARWKVLGLNLGLMLPYLEEIQADHGGRVQECLQKMLLHWLRRSHDEIRFGPPTWNNLANAMEKSGNRAVAHAIRQKHQCELYFPNR